MLPTIAGSVLAICCSSASAAIIASYQFGTGNAAGSAAKQEGGLFITFHGSWNRAPLPQEGFRVAFAPFSEGKPTGSYRTFATLPGNSLRAVGVAVGKDGALFISADNSDTIWRVVRQQ